MQRKRPQCTIRRRKRLVTTLVFFLTCLRSCRTFANGRPSRQRVSLRVSNSASSVEFVDSETGCQVVLLGCFHGTVSSAKEVEELLLREPTDVVALELCASRFEDLRRDLARRQRSNSNKSWLLRYLDMVLKTSQKRGMATGMAAAILGGVSGLQTALSGFTPGLEFTTALRIATKCENDCDIILADQAVDETLKRLGNLPLVAIDIITRNRARKHHEILITAIWGDKKAAFPQVQLPKVLTRNQEAIKDLIRLATPPVLLFQVIFATMNQAMGTLQTDALDAFSHANQANSNMGFNIANLASEALPHWIASVLIVSLAYFGIALPAVQVILDERDEQLANGIRAACRLAASKSRAKRGRVVAVLGLLHVNGVAKRFLSEEAVSRL